jgi:hypothetical protein
VTGTGKHHSPALRFHLHQDRPGEEAIERSRTWYWDYQSEGGRWPVVERGTLAPESVRFVQRGRDAVA